MARILVRNRRIEAPSALLERPGHQTEAPGAEEQIEGHIEGRADRQRLDALFLAGLYRSRGDWERAADVYERSVHASGCVLALLALAKLREHRTKELGL